MFFRPAHLLQRVDEMRISDNIVRQPRGPDPTGLANYLIYTARLFGLLGARIYLFDPHSVRFAAY